MEVTKETIHELLEEQAKEFAVEAIHQVDLLSKLVALQTGALELQQAVDGTDREVLVEKVEDSAKSLATIIKLGLGALSQIADTANIDIRTLLNEDSILPFKQEISAPEPLIPLDGPRVATAKSEATESQQEAQAQTNNYYTPQELHEDFIEEADIINPSFEQNGINRTDISLHELGVVRIGGKEFQLSEKEIALFNILLLNRNEYIPRSTVIEHGFSFKSPNIAAKGQAFSKAKHKLFSRFKDLNVFDISGDASSSKYRLSEKLYVIDCRTNHSANKVKKN